MYSTKNNTPNLGRNETKIRSNPSHILVILLNNILNNQYDIIISIGRDNAIYNHNLFACLVVIKYFMKKKEYTSLINQIDSLMTMLEKKTTTIIKNELLDYIGVPQNYKEMLTK